MGVVWRFTYTTILTMLVYAFCTYATAISAYAQVEVTRVQWVARFTEVLNAINEDLEVCPTDFFCDNELKTANVTVDDDVIMANVIKANGYVIGKIVEL